MPAEVIELLSSPAAPLAIVNKSAPNCSNVRTYEASNSSSVPIEISDGEVEDWDLPPPQWLPPKINQASSRNPISNPLAPLSEDSDGEVKLFKAGNTSATKTQNTLGEATGSTANVGRSKHGFMADFNFNMLDDRFSSDEPAPKRARLSPSPPSVINDHSAYKRATSNVESLKKSSTRGGSSRPLRRSSTMSAVPESDPIVATSSPDPFADAAKRREKNKQTTKVQQGYDEFFDIDSSPVKKRSGRGSNDALSNAESDSDDLLDLEALTARAVAKPSSGRSSKSALAKFTSEREKEKKAAEKAGKAKTKEADKARKAREKEDEKDRKRLEKEKAANEKKIQTEIAKLNTLKTDKKVSSPEMIVDFPSSLDPALVGVSQGLLEPMNIEHSKWRSEEPIIRWRRKVDSVWNEDARQFVPISFHICALGNHRKSSTMLETHLVITNVHHQRV